MNVMKASEIIDFIFAVVRMPEYVSEMSVVQLKEVLYFIESEREKQKTIGLICGGYYIHKEVYEAAKSLVEMRLGNIRGEQLEVERIEIQNRVDELNIRHGKSLPPIQKKSERDKQKELQIIKKHLEFLSGYSDQYEKNLSESEYKRLIEMVVYMVDHLEIPKGEKPFTLIGVTQMKIRKSFHNIHTEMYSNGKNKVIVRDCYIDFLHDYFPEQFTCEWSTTKSKFSQ